MQTDECKFLKWDVKDLITIVINVNNTHYLILKNKVSEKERQ